MPHLDHIAPLLASLAGSAVGTFVLAVLVDDALGVLLAVKQKSFDIHALPSFLLTQLGTREAIVLAGLIITAALAGGDVKTAVSIAATAGAVALTATVLADVKDKIWQVVGK